MTVNELMAELSGCDEDSEVIIEHECEGADVAALVQVDRVVASSRSLREVIITTRM